MRRLAAVTVIAVVVSSAVFSLTPSQDATCCRLIKVDNNVSDVSGCGMNLSLNVSRCDEIIETAEEREAEWLQNNAESSQGEEEGWFDVIVSMVTHLVPW